MPDENSKMEDLLKAYAKKRREEAGQPAEMHPATRQMLQGEVRSTFRGKSESEARPRFFWWPRLAAACVLALAAVALLLPALNQPKNKSMKMVQATVEQTEVRASRSEPPTLIGKEKLAEKPRGYRASDLPSISADAITGNEVVTITNSLSYSLSTQTLGAPIDTFKSEFKRSAKVNETTQSWSMLGGEKVQLGNTVTGIPFVQQPLSEKAAQLAPPPAVMTRFQFSQDGTNVSITDADGSVYQGVILMVGDRTKPEDLAKEEEKTKAPATMLTVPFRVAGTNQQLGRPITFTGKFSQAIPATNTKVQAGAAVEASAALRNAPAGEADKPAPATHGLIQGVLNIGGTNEFELNAIQTPP